MERPRPLQKAREYEIEQGRKIDSIQRPLLHLSPYMGWMNDPNGFCYYEGQYHLFYQYYPYDRVWGPMHWGHAVSQDLLEWNYLPCAMAPDTDADAGGCFSGTAVVGENGELMLFYTGVQLPSSSHPSLQTQCLAIGDGRDFEKVRENPIIHPSQLPKGYSHVDFRDPKVWREDDKYYMLVANRHETKSGTILLFQSTDARKWNFLSEIDASYEKHGRMWECPDLFHLDNRCVILVSPQEMEAGEELHAGFGTLALLGKWSTENHSFQREEIQVVDYGLDFYAPQSVLSPDGRRIIIGWMENWETSTSSSRKYAWYSRMSLPRELRIKNGRLLQQPIQEIKQYWQDTKIGEYKVSERCSINGVDGRTLDLTVELERQNTKCRRFIIHLAANEEYYTELRINLARNELFFDRSKSGTRRDIVHSRQIKLQDIKEKLSLRIVLDKECIEIFVGEGEQVISAVIETAPEIDGIFFSADAEINMHYISHYMER